MIVSRGNSFICLGNYHSIAGDKYEAVYTDSGYNKYMMLKIRNVGPKDFGSYKCVAQNSLGGTDGDIKLDGEWNNVSPNYELYRTLSVEFKNAKRKRKICQLCPRS